MAEYIEREALLDDLLDRDCECADKSKQDIGNWLLHEYVYGLVKEQPTADVVEVVRCKDCVYCEDELFCICAGQTYLSVTPNHFCGHGVKMDGKGE
jgi:hypothetical protein